MTRRPQRIPRLLAVDPPEQGSTRLTELLEGAFSGSAAEFATERAADLDRAVDAARAAAVAGEPFALIAFDAAASGKRTLAQALQSVWRVSPSTQALAWVEHSDPRGLAALAELGHDDRVLLCDARSQPQALLQSCRVLARKQRAELESSEHSRLQQAHRRLSRELERLRYTSALWARDALHDALTQLPNRVLLCERIDRSIAQHKRDPKFRFAVLFMDLNDFKSVNDRFGHAVGDRLIQEVAARIVNCCRQSDCSSRNVGNTAARLGGDEFVVLLDGLASEGDARFVAERILDAISQPITLGSTELRPGASIGIALSSLDYDDAQSILHDADMALCRAKERPDISIAVFDQKMRLETLARVKVEQELRAAIEEEHLFLEYQPIVSLPDLQIRGFEALVRWRHPQQGVLQPRDFVPIAETSGVIFSLSEWVLRRAIRQAQTWRARWPRYGELFITVNLSSRQLAAPHFVQDLAKLLDDAGQRLDLVRLEISDDASPRSIWGAAESEAGVVENDLKLGVDAFGTRLASLDGAQRLIISAVKLERALLRAGTVRECEPAIRAMIEAARSRNVQVIAEGVETPEQFAFVQSLGCGLAQGFHFSRPLDAPSVERALEVGPHLLHAA